MKRRFFAVLLVSLLLPALAACGKHYDYTKHLSEVKSDLFLAETEEFSVTVCCISREYPYASDGIACPRSELIEISLVSRRGDGDYSVYLVDGDRTLGGDAAFRNVRGDYYYSQGVEEFPEGNVTVRVEWGTETREFVAASVKTEHTLSPEEALNIAVEHEKDVIGRMTQKKRFMGEFRVRLLRRDDTYYYVGIFDGAGKIVALLLDSETGEVLARRESA